MSDRPPTPDGTPPPDRTVPFVPHGGAPTPAPPSWPSGQWPAAGQGGPPPPPPPSGQWPAAGQGGPPPPSGQWPAPGQEGTPPAPRKRGRRRAAIAVVGVLALGATGFFATRALTGDSGGASSPEAAVQALADGIGAEDPAAIAAALAPDEVRSLGALLDEVEDQAAEGGLAGPRSTFSGVDVSVTDLELDVDELGDDVARVTISDGSIGYELDREGLADKTRSLVPEDIEQSDSIEVDDVDDDIDELYLMAIRQDGGWYVSLTYTVASYAAAEWDLPEGDFDEAPDLADGAEDPEAAVRELVEAGGSLDPEGVLDRLPEGEWSVIAGYERAITDVIEGDSDQVYVSISDVEVEVDETDLEVEDASGSTRRVVISGAEGSVSWNDEDGSHRADWELDGWCMDITDDDGDESSGCLFEDESVAGQIFDVGDPFVVVVEERGGWVVSPNATIIEMARDLVPQITPDVFLNLIGRPDRIEPTSAITVGESLDGEIGPAGASTYRFTPEEDASVLLNADYGDDDYVDVSLVDADGEYVSYDGGSGQEVSGGEEYRVVAEGDIGDPFTVALGQVVVEDLPADAFTEGVSGRLDLATPSREYRFSPSDDISVSMSVSDAAYAVIDGVDSYCEAYPGESASCSLSAGVDYVLSVSSDGDDPDVPFTITFEEGGGDVTIDGDSSTSGFILDNGSYAYHQLEVAAGVTARVVVTGSDGSDIDVRWDGFSETATGETEEFYVDGPFDGEIELYLYSSSTGDADYSIDVYAE